MHSKRSRLDRFLSAYLNINRNLVKPLLAQGRVKIDGTIATDVHQLVDEFTRVEFDNQIVQAKQPVYLMLNKPAGVVCATKDKKHKTVIDLLQRTDREQLHIVGRLDFNSTGLVLLTNDGRWSRHLTQPQTKVAKRYRVTLEHPINADYVQAFAEGMYFPFENLTTRPAKLHIIDDYTADVFLTEGRYHQIKRMFGRFQNPVMTLHRTAIGTIELDKNLIAGNSRELTTEEIRQSNFVC